MSKIQIKKVSFIAKLVNIILYPFRFIAGGFKKENIQETGFWNIQSIDPELIDLSFTAQGISGNKSWIKKHGGPFFHIPIIGGWNEYIVFEAETNEPWHVGWIIRYSDSNELKQAAVQLLPIYEKQIKLLKLSDQYIGHAIAFNKNGIQIPIKQIYEGRLGDGKYQNVRLF